jgi:hypothetical protein
MPALAAAQSQRGDRSRGRSEATRVVQTERTVKRTKAVEKKRAKKRERVRVREDKIDRSEAKRRKSRRGDRRVKGSSPKLNDSRSTGQDARRKKSKTVKHRTVKDNKGRRKAVKHKKKRRKAIERRKDRREAIKHRKDRRKAVKHKRDRRKVARHKRGVRRAIRKAARWATGNGRHHHRRHVKRHTYRHRRYHPSHRHGLSIGFYIRPWVRWYAGNTRRFVFSQAVSGHPSGDLEVRSTLTRQIRKVRRDYVEVEFELDRIAVTAAGRYLGDVDRFPGKLRKVRAKIYRDGFVEFDRMLYVIGNEITGFELLSTRYCGGDVARASYECLNARSGDLDFYDGKVHATGYSRLLEPLPYGRVVSVALVPDEEYSGFQYVVGYGRSNDGYYNGSFDYSTLSRFDSNGNAYRLSGDDAISAFESSNGYDYSYGGAGDPCFAHESVVAYRSDANRSFALHRRTDIRYLDD